MGGLSELCGGMFTKDLHTQLMGPVGLSLEKRDTVLVPHTQIVLRADASVFRACAGKRASVDGDDEAHADEIDGGEELVG